MGDVGLQRAGGIGRRPVAPDRLGQPLDGDDLAAREDEDDEDGPLAGSAEVEGRVAGRGRAGAQQADPQLRGVVHSSSFAGKVDEDGPLRDPCSVFSAP